jgi:cytochrome P450
MLNACRNTVTGSAPHPPGPRTGLVPERLLWAFRRSPLQFLSGMAREYGDIVQLPLGRRKIYLLNHPDFIRQVLVTDQASFGRGLAHLHPNSIWLDSSQDQPVEAEPRLLELLQPFYEPYSVVGFKALIASQVSRLIQGWHTGQVLDLPVELSRLTGSLAAGLLAELSVPSQLQDRTLAILQAGQAAESSVLVSALFLLAEHPEVENQALAEIQNIFMDSDPLSVDIQSLVYTRMLLAETLRLYPPVSVLHRQALRDCNIGGYTIQAGENIWLSPWLVQHDPRFFPEPGQFDPQRWSSEAQLGHYKYSFFPFGAGPRRCLGEEFAWLQGVFVLALLLAQWKCEPLPGRPIFSSPLFGLQPKSVSPIVLRGR